MSALRFWHSVVFLRDAAQLVRVSPEFGEIDIGYTPNGGHGMING